MVQDLLRDTLSWSIPGSLPGVLPYPITLHWYENSVVAGRTSGSSTFLEVAACTVTIAAKDQCALFFINRRTAAECAVGVLRSAAVFPCRGLTFPDRKW